MLWQTFPKISSSIRKSFSSYDDLTAQLLYNRGFKTVNEVEKFFNPDSSDLPDRRNLRDLDKAVKEILETVKSGGKIVIYGDYDVDGVCSSTILFDFLYRDLKAKVVPYIPSRFEEGYGLNITALEKISQEGADLMITVDCGVRDGKLLRGFGNKEMRVIITDHHEPPEDSEDLDALLESAYAVVHPTLSDKYHFKQICATTVAWYLLCELVSQAKDQNLIKTEINPEKYLDLVALATVCDIMPLVDQNRILLKCGVEKIQNTENLGLKELLINAGVYSQELKPYHLGYVIGPRLNAAGRLESALDALRLLTSKDSAVISKLAKKLSDLNSERQVLTKEYIKKAEEQIAQSGSDNNLLFIVGENWPEGIVGLVAGKICEKYHKPVLVASLDGHGTAIGSARSIKSFHITEAISESADILERFGGHSQAAGFTVKQENLETFRENMFRLSEAIGQEDLEKKLQIEYELAEDMINHDTIELVNKFEPFGFGNKQPIFSVRQVSLLDKKIIGSSGEHIKLFVKKGDTTLEVVGFNKVEHFSRINKGDRFDIAGYLEENKFMNTSRIQLNLSDISLDETKNI